jgi:hypothetical protein
MVAIGVPRNSLIDGEIPEELPSKAKGEWGEREGEALCYILDAMYFYVKKNNEGSKRITD